MINAHQRYYPDDWTPSECREKLFDVKKRGSGSNLQKKLSSMMEVSFDLIN